MYFRFFSRLFLSASLVLLISGCALGALDKQAQSIDLSKESVVILSLDLTNEFKPDSLASHLGMQVKKIETDGTPSKSALIWSMGLVEPVSKIALASKQIPAGSYTIEKLVGVLGSPLFAGNLDFSVDAPFNVLPNSVIYLGHVRLVNKERIGKDDQASGLAIPLIPQAVHGMGNGTLNVKLEDRYDSIVLLLKQDYPALKNLTIVRAPLASMTLERSSGSKAPIVKVMLSQP